MNSIGPVGSTGSSAYFYPIFETTEPAESDVASTWQSLSDRQKREYDDLVRSGALALALPQLRLDTFNTIAGSFGNIFSIANLDISKLATMSMQDLSRTVALAEQEMITKFLNNWVEAEQKLAERLREDQKRFDILYFDALKRTAQTYMQSIDVQRQELAVLPLTLLLAACTVDSTVVVEASSSVGNIARLSTFASAPPALIQELSAIANGLVTLGMAWAAPAAIALSAPSGGQSTALDKDAAKAYAIAIAALVTNPDIDRLLSASLEAAIHAGSITPEQAQGMMAAFKASLLIQATAMLYRAEFGGITKEEIQQLIKGGTTLPESDFLTTLAKLVQEQLQLMDPFEAEKFVEECTAKYDQDLSSQSLLAPLVQFLSLWDPRIYQDTSQQQPS